MRRSSTWRAFAASFVLVSVAVLADPGSSEELRWVDQFGSEKKDVAWGAALYGSTLYVCGETEAALPTQGAFGEDDAFLRSYGIDGTRGWTEQFGTRSSDQCFGVATGSGGISVVGRTFGKLAGQNRRGGFDAFVRTYDANGERRWTQQFGTRRSDAAFGVATDSSGNLYVAGFTQGKLGGLPYRGDGDAFVRKLDPTGRVMWTREFGSRRLDFAFAVAADDTGVYVAGATRGALPQQRNRGEIDLFVRKYGASGHLEWTHQLGTDREDYAYGIAQDDSGVYVAGYTKGKFVEPGAGGGDAVLVKLASDGRRVWLEQFGTDKSDLAFAVATDGTLVYVVGSTDGAFGGFANQGERDVFARAFDPDGQERWTYQFGTERKDSANWAAAGAGLLFLVGYVEGELPQQSGSGDRDAFVASIA